MFILDRIYFSVRPELHHIAFSDKPQRFRPNWQRMCNTRTVMGSFMSNTIYPHVVSITACSMQIVRKFGLQINKTTTARTVSVLVQGGNIDRVINHLAIRLSQYPSPHTTSAKENADVSAMRR